MRAQNRPPREQIEGVSNCTASSSDSRDDAGVFREGAAWVYDPRTVSLILFGGWANRWLGDTWKLNVSSIIGPPYACTTISPERGPVFGDTAILIKGLRFTDGKIQVFSHTSVSASLGMFSIHTFVSTSSFLWQGTVWEWKN